VTAGLSAAFAMSDGGVWLRRLRRLRAPKPLLRKPSLLPSLACRPVQAPTAPRPQKLQLSEAVRAALLACAQAGMQRLWPPSEGLRDR
jgi:hypothetical protein